MISMQFYSLRQAPRLDPVTHAEGPQVLKGSQNAFDSPNAWMMPTTQLEHACALPSLCLQSPLQLLCVQSPLQLPNPRPPHNVNPLT